MDFSQAHDLSDMRRRAQEADRTPDPAPAGEIVEEEMTNLVPLAGLGVQLVNVMTEEGSTLGMVIEVAAPGGAVVQYLAPASASELVQKALNDFRGDLNRAVRGEDVEVPQLVIGGQG